MKQLYTLIALLTLSISAQADDWQSTLPDDAYIAEVSMPGTHDTGTGCGFPTSVSSLGELFAQTQDLDLASQWAAGVRAFDLRPRVSGDTTLVINHGIITTNLTFDDALATLRDSLQAHPTEFAIIHLRHETEGDSSSDNFETLLHKALEDEGVADYIVDFSRDLTVADMRGKMLFLYRDSYTTHPAGGEMSGWVGYVDWSAQTKGSITGGGSGSMNTATLYMQDYSDTSDDGAVDTKCDALRTMLDFSTTQTISGTSDLVWVYNFASAYSKTTSLFGSEVSLSEGYRDNASYTNAAIIDYMASHDAGPMGIILMDYAGVDSSDTYATRGQELIDVIIANNTAYFEAKLQQQLIDAHWDSLQTLLDSVSTLRTALRAELKANCADVFSDFSSRLTAINTKILKERSRLSVLYNNGEMTLEDGFDFESYLEELEAIRTEAYAAQEAYTTGVAAPAASGSSGGDTLYNLSGQRVGSLPSKGIVVVRHSDGSASKRAVR